MTPDPSVQVPREDAKRIAGLFDRMLSSEADISVSLYSAVMQEAQRWSALLDASAAGKEEADWQCPTCAWMCDKRFVDEHEARAAIDKAKGKQGIPLYCKHPRIERKPRRGKEAGDE